MSIEEFNINYKYFIDKLTVLYGESGTGKSTIITDICYHLRQYIDQIIVFAPTDNQNKSYSGEMVPISCVHKEVRPKILENIWERQCAFVSVQEQANNKQIIQSIYDKLKLDDSAITAKIKKIREEYIIDMKQKSNDIDIIEQGIKENDAKIAQMMHSYYKMKIRQNYNKLAADIKLTDKEKFSLKYMDINPKIIIIFDDCTDQLNSVKTNPVIQKIAYQGRHAQITTIIGCHTDKCLDSAFRKNVHVTMFTEKTSANTFFERKTNDLDKETKRTAFSIGNEVFNPQFEYQKLVWIKLERKYYKYTAKKRSGFQIGGSCIWQFCRLAQNDSKESVSNKYRF